MVTCLGTGIEFPDKIGEYKRGEVKTYAAEPDQVGVAIQYSSDSAAVSIYVRALGKDAQKTAEYFLKDSFAGVKAFEAQGTYSNVKIYEVSPEKEKPGWKSGAFTSSTTNRFIASFIHCKVVSGHLVKIRATVGSSKFDGAQACITSLQEIVDKASKKP